MVWADDALQPWMPNHLVEVKQTMIISTLSYHAHRDEWLLHHEVINHGTWSGNTVKITALPREPTNLDWLTICTYLKTLMGDIGIQCNNSWFVIHDSSRSFHKSYLSKRHIFHELFRVNRTHHHGLKNGKQVPNYSIAIFCKSLEDPFHYFLLSCRRFISRRNFLKPTCHSLMKNTLTH